LEFVSHNGLDIEVYDLRPADLHYYYYYYYYYYYISEVSRMFTTGSGNCTTRKWSVNA